MDPILYAIQQVLNQTRTTDQSKALIVGLSGGVDSVVLLHAIHQLFERQALQWDHLLAVHVNHGISPNASAWQGFCKDYCMHLDIGLIECEIVVKPKSRQSIEAEARTRRYEQLTHHAKSANGLIVTAHHQDDQLETVLLQLKRGAGPKGLSGMASWGEMRGVALVRPFLSVSRAQIESYANHHKLSWIEDESNQDTHYDRNFLRQQVLPIISNRWPSFAATVSRSAQLCAQQQTLIDEVCDQRLELLANPIDQLSLALLKEYSLHWQYALVRRWLEHNQLPMPSRELLEQIVLMEQADDDRQPKVRLAKSEIRRFNNVLYCILEPKDVPQAFAGVALQLDVAELIPCLAVTVEVSLQPNERSHHITLASLSDLQLIKPSLATKIKPQGKPHSKPIKQWFKQWMVPTWERQSALLLLSGSLPSALIYSGKLVRLSVSGGVDAHVTLQH